MLKIRGALLAIILLLVFTYASKSIAQDISNEGRSFWTVFPSHVPANGHLATMKLFITSQKNTRGVVNIGGVKLQDFQIQAAQITEIDIPYDKAYLGDRTTQNTTKGIQVLVDDADPAVVVYAHIYASARSEATLLLPIEGLGYSYYAMGWRPKDQYNARFVFNIVAITETTTVIIQQRINNTLSSTLTVTLNHVGDVYQFVGNADEDYTGTHVKVDPTNSECKTFAMFSGDNLAYIPSTALTGDPLFQQLYATNYWWKKYVYVPFKGPDKGNYLRIIAKEDNTKVEIGNITSVILQQGAFYTSDLITTAEIISADKPISVAQFALSQQAAFITYNSNSSQYSDPDMVMLNPIESRINSITVFSSKKENIKNRFINIVIEDGAAASFKVNGRPVPASNATFTPIGTSGFSYMQLDVGVAPYNTVSSFRLTANEGFNAICYGFGDFESYAYSAGTNLSTDVSLAITDPDLGTDLSVVRRDKLFKPKLTLAYPSEELQWDFGSMSGTSSLTKTDYISIVRDGITFYEYLFANDINYATSGNKKIKIKIKLPPSTDNCSPNGYKNFEEEIEVYDIPEAKIGAVSESCMNQPVVFSDWSTSIDSNSAQWIWDFGDGSATSTLENSTHTYAISGTYTATLTVTTADGCASSVTQTITIWELPISSFTHTGLTCPNNPIHFTDASTSADGVITHWYWDFGNGPESALSNTTHTFPHTGIYPVSLTVETDKGCKSAFFAQTIIIQPYPQVEFEFPRDLCLKKPATLPVAFTNTTTISDGSILTYLWNFGDLHASVADNASALKDPSHVYSKSGTYTVTLNVTSASGCSTSTTHIILIHGNPQPDFTVSNASQLCSSEKVVFEDKASVDFGEITRIEWYYDLDHHPTVKFEDNQPNSRNALAKQYTHQYAVFNTPLTQSYTIKMVAYSAHFCVSEITKTIILKAVPDAVFDPIPDVCVNNGPLSLSAHIIGPLTGTWKFSGKGVSREGKFSPSVAGVGDHILTYTLMGANGCPIVKTRTVVVHPLPTVHAGGTQVILYGEHIQIPASAHGTHLTYKWSPATNLNRDDILNPTASPSHDIRYKLVATSKDGCTSEGKRSNEDIIFIKVLPLLKIPNTFTPNGDGINDTWVIKNLDKYVGATVEIFNRHGAKVFHAEGNYKPWDGKLGNQDLPVGTYFYFINPHNRHKVISGSIAIIR